MAPRKQPVHAEKAKKKAEKAKAKEQKNAKKKADKEKKKEEQEAKKRAKKEQKEAERKAKKEKKEEEKKRKQEERDKKRAEKATEKEAKKAEVNAKKILAKKLKALANQRKKRSSKGWNGCERCGYRSESSAEDVTSEEEFNSDETETEPEDEYYSEEENSDNEERSESQGGEESDEVFGAFDDNFDSVHEDVVCGGEGGVGFEDTLQEVDENDSFRVVQVDPAENIRGHDEYDDRFMDGVEFGGAAEVQGEEEDKDGEVEMEDLEMKEGNEGEGVAVEGGKVTGNTFGLFNCRLQDPFNPQKSDVISSLAIFGITVNEPSFNLVPETTWKAYLKRPVYALIFTADPTLATLLHHFLTSPEFLDVSEAQNIKEFGNDIANHVCLCSDPTKQKRLSFAYFYAAATVAQKNKYRARACVDRVEIYDRSGCKKTYDLARLAKGAVMARKCLTLVTNPAAKFIVQQVRKGGVAFSRNIDG